MAFNPGVFWEKRLSSTLNLQGVGYSTLGLPFNVWMYQVRAFVFRRALHSVPTGRTVLDIGSGTGFYIALLQSAGKEVSGIDISLSVVERLKRIFPALNIRVRDIGSAEFSTQPAYDVATAMDVLFHIIDDGAFRRAIQHINACLKPGGYFFYAENMPESRVTYAHQVSRSAHEVTATLTQEGFEIVSVQPMFILMNQPIASTNRLLRMWWRLLSGILIRNPWLGHVLGPILYLVELLLVQLIRKGPSTKILICKKVR